MEDSIVNFLVRAKKATYAGKGSESQATRPHSHDLIYSENNLKYIDTYLGSSYFAGEEALWLDDQPFWAMNYVGRVVNDGFESNFLKECLLKVPIEMPFRGPRENRKGDLLYTCEVIGDFKWFSGKEMIFKGDVKVYECLFHGGKIRG